ncbi:MAG: hypothetical protein ACYC9W_09065, partial [Candidatus Limnocylindria bacterium]
APEPPPAWDRPVPSWEQPARPAQSWEQPAPAREWTPPETDRREDLAAALDARLGLLPAAPAEPEVAPPASPIDIPPAADLRLAALGGVFGPAQRAVPVPDSAAEATPEAAPEEKKRGLFGFLRRDEPTPDAEIAAPPEPGAPAAAPLSRRAGRLASLANALLGEYNSGQYGKGRLDDRMANLLMRVDEQADPIDRPLPVVDDRIDAPALDRENMPEQQVVPYLAMLVTQIYQDAERTFGKDKAKRGYRAAQQQVFESDASMLSEPDVAGRLPQI